ncbi:MAG: maltokinase N-terminal cap-like domain-containing protein [Solirubrobacteraceae bacterium]
MSEQTPSPVATEAQRLDLEEVAVWLERQRWYASKSRHIAGLELDDCVTLAESPPLLLTLMQARFASGSHELYQLPLALVAPERDPGPTAVARTDEWVAIDAVADAERARALLRAMDTGAQLEGESGCVRFRRADAEPTGQLALHAPARTVGVEQSNSSIVFGDETVLKVFRRLEPGVNPELELLRFLGERSFEHIAPLQGWYEYDGRGYSCTLGVAQRFIADAVGGWEWALELIGSEPETLLQRLGSLGTVTAELHNALASDAGDPAFSPEEPSAESLSLLTATIDEDIERIFTRLPDDERLAAIVGRGQDVREQLSMRAQTGPGGRSIRTHGDYHLGQTLHIARDGASRWLIIDFEGEPARPLFERRQKRSPLRDVASMLRSFAYAASASEVMRGRPAPPEIEARARNAFLEGYFGTIDAGLLPAGEAAIWNLLAIFELEKAVYELQYELDNRPKWLPIPAAGIARLLESA